MTRPKFIELRTVLGAAVLVNLNHISCVTVEEGTTRVYSNIGGELYWNVQNTYEELKVLLTECNVDSLNTPDTQFVVKCQICQGSGFNCMGEDVSHKVCSACGGTGTQYRTL